MGSVLQLVLPNLQLCSWIDRLVSGLYPATKRPIKTDFYGLWIRPTFATEYKSLTHYTKGTQSHHEGAPTACMHAVSGSISLHRGSFAFPSRYSFTIGQSGVFSLGGWSPHIQTRFHVPRSTRHHYVCPRVIREYHLHVHFPERSTKHIIYRLIPVRLPLLRESQLISFPKGTEMFHFPRSPCNTMYSCCNTYL